MNNGMDFTKRFKSLGWPMSRLFASLIVALVPLANAMAVNIDQSPLTVQKPLPPNIVLMLDDSGSMGSDYMPDSLANWRDQGRHSSAVNGVYYNPTNSYAAPNTATGGSYASSSFNSAWSDGFSQSGSKDLNYYAYAGRTSYNYCSSHPQYTCDHRNGDYYVYEPFYYYSYNGGSGCSLSTNSCFTKHYVRDTCPSGLSTDCKDDSATKQSVANWYSFYRTRMLMAKSGLMNAFSTLDPAYRVGFGSINGRSAGWIYNHASPYYPFSTSTNSHNRLSEVQVWGDGSSGTQKAKFWSWLLDEYASGSTPLRGALDAVGQYYKTDQPWETSSSDSSKLSCRQSYAILMTDGFWNGGNPSVGNQDNTAGATTLGSNSYSPQLPYKDDQSNTLADVAMKYWKTDLRGSLDNNVPVTPNDPADWQHMTTFTVGLGFDPTGIQPAGTTISDIFNWARTGTTNIDTTQFSWPTPQSNSPNNIADLAHAAVNGHGGFFSAKDPAAFQTGIASALAAVNNHLGNGNGVAFDSATLTPNNSMQYVASYYTGQWTGRLVAETADSSGNYSDQNVTWDAVSELPAWNQRTIMTTKLVAGKGNQAASTTPVAFTAGNLSSAQQTALTSNIGGGISATSASIVDYLRGDTQYDIGNVGGVFRARKSLIGDIVHSTPAYVPPPKAGAFSGRVFDGSADYGSFVTNEASRSPMIYVAANDGMLHAFNAQTGVEQYAFIPGAVLRQTGDAALSRLANPQYGVANGVSGTQPIPHQYFNDGEMTVASVYMNKAWHTLLVGTTGRGPAKAVYALDITDPANISVLWERSADDGRINSDYIGQMLGKPIIAEVTTGNNSSKWVVLIGNGANSTQDKAALLQFDVANGDLSVYSAGSGGSTAASNGLAGPAVWQADGSNNISTDAYAGDLQGNVWHFSLGANGSSGAVIYHAQDAAGNPQPITAQMFAATNPTDSSRWLFFGTGRYLAQSDISQSENAKVQTWYGLRVHSATSTIPVVDSGSNRTNLRQRTIVAEQSTANGRISRATSVAASNDMSGKQGWYMDLISPSGEPRGERIVQQSQDIAGYLYVSTLMPVVQNACNPYPQGAIMAVDPFTGANPNRAIQDTNGDGKLNSGDSTQVGGETVFFNATVLDVAVGGALNAQKINGGQGIRITYRTLEGKPGGGDTIPNSSQFSRLSWREIVNQ